MLDIENTKRKMQEINKINQKYNLVRVARFLNFLEYSLQIKFPLITDIVFLWKHLIFVFIELSISFSRKNKQLIQLLTNELDYDVLDVLSGKNSIKVYYPSRSAGFYSALFKMYASTELIKIRKVQGEHAFLVKGKYPIELKKAKFSTQFIDAMTRSQEYIKSTVDVYPDTYFLVLKRNFEKRTLLDVPYECLLYVYEAEIISKKSLK